MFCTHKNRFTNFSSYFIFSIYSILLDRSNNNWLHQLDEKQKCVYSKYSEFSGKDIAYYIITNFYDKMHFENGLLLAKFEFNIKYAWDFDIYP